MAGVDDSVFSPESVDRELAYAPNDVPSTATNATAAAVSFIV